MKTVLMQPVDAEITGNWNEADVGMALGVPQDSLLYRVQEVPYHVSDRSASAFADDAILMEKNDEGLQQLLDICSSWGNDMQMPWNTANGVSSNTTGVTPDKHVERVVSAQRRLGSLAGAGLHRNGFDTRSCVRLCRVFVRSIYEYELHLVPLTPQLELASEAGSNFLQTGRRKIVVWIRNISSSDDASTVPLGVNRTATGSACHKTPSRLPIVSRKSIGDGNERLRSAEEGEPSMSRIVPLHFTSVNNPMLVHIKNIITTGIEPFRVREWKNVCARCARKISCGTTARYPAILQLRELSQRMIGISWYFNEYPPTPEEARSFLGIDYWRYEGLKFLLEMDD
ncbi:hypothetical protein FGB62_35g08 [Gracilaria domingensis]|nr:hypothetical protein FGB62_35g08 [Gracilaria domingensis]